MGVGGSPWSKGWHQAPFLPVFCHTAWLVFSFHPGWKGKKALAYADTVNLDFSASRRDTKATEKVVVGAVPGYYRQLEGDAGAHCEEHCKAVSSQHKAQRLFSLQGADFKICNWY